MKKSDFLKELYEAVDDYLDSRKHFEYNNLVDMIVDKSIELGMSPPKVNGVYDSAPTVTPTGNYEYSYKRGWDDENG